MLKFLQSVFDIITRFVIIPLVVAVITPLVLLASVAIWLYRVLVQAGGLGVGLVRAGHSDFEFEQRECSFLSTMFDISLVCGTKTMQTFYPPKRKLTASEVKAYFEGDYATFHGVDPTGICPIRASLRPVELAFILAELNAWNNGRYARKQQRRGVVKEELVSTTLGVLAAAIGLADTDFEGNVADYIFFLKVSEFKDGRVFYHLVGEYK